jgi:predicted Fe-Mo cluster-binding NifX family protein
MKICMPTAGNGGMTEKVFDHFGSARYFTIYDTDTKSIEVVENGKEHHAHGACQPLSVVASHEVDAIMTNGIGRRAVRLFNDGGIKVYALDGNTVKEAIGKFEANDLVELTVENACGGHEQGHGCH